MASYFALTDNVVSLAAANFTLFDGDSLFVGANATVLQAGTGRAITASGTVSIQINGDVAKIADDYAIYTSGLTRLTIGREGSVLSPFVAVEVLGAGSVIANNGMISAQQYSGIELTGSNSILTNAGTIEGGYLGVFLVGDGSRFINTGAVVQLGTQPGFGNGVYAQGNNIVIENLGTISAIQAAGINVATASDQVSTTINRGQIDSAAGIGIRAGNGSDTIINTGRINGSIDLRGGNDSIDLRYGVITGTISGGSGNDRFSIDTSNGSGIERLDGGDGSDTLDLSGGSDAVWIDLNFLGTQVWSTTGGIATGANANTMLARAVNLENITGSLGSDVLYGNDLVNTFTWSGNVNTVADIYVGRGGSDTADFSSAASVWVDLTALANEVYTSGRTVAFGAEANTLVANLDSIENISGTGGSDEIYGDAANNTFSSGGIARLGSSVQFVERFDGRGGSDTYDLSTSTLPSAWVDLTLATEVYSSFLNTSTGANANSAIADLTAVENIVGTSGSDQFFGDANNNTYFFNGFTTGTAEVFDGRAGTNTFDGSRSNISLWIGLNNPAMEVWSVNSTAQSTGANANTQVANLAGVQNIVGSQYADTLIGDGGFNRIDGFGGFDIITGGAGNDTFVFSKGPQILEHRITDFAGGAGIADVIEVSGFGAAFDTFAEVFAASSQLGANTLFDFGTGSELLTLSNFTRTNLVADDFVFV